MTATKHSNIDAIDTATGQLTKASALVDMLEAAGLEGGGFSVPHSSVMSVLWSLRDHVTQAQGALGGISLRG
jgi:hypothetical protein